MTFIADLDRLLDTVLSCDPSFKAANASDIKTCADAARRAAQTNSKETFLFAAMRLMALAKNGHTRLIPNDSISVLPVRFVAIGDAVFLTQTQSENTAASRPKLVRINGVPIENALCAFESVLAGTHQRKRVIGPLLLAWPFALAHFGLASNPTETTYQLVDDDGTVKDLVLSHANVVPASDLYPRNEHGKAKADWVPDRFVEIKDWGSLGLSICLPSFFDPSEVILPKEIFAAANRVKSHPDCPILIDVRGNTGGDFLKTMPLIEAITEHAKNGRVAVLVDKFTFSAAIVFVAILKYRLKDRLKIIGEEMGDGLTFFAEGGLLELPASGAVVRYSTAFHDWQTGSIDQTTPSEIAQQIVGAGEIAIDQKWAALTDDGKPLNQQYRIHLERFT